jgi:dinuclear metal center YbgI/SA1388 family protein
MLKIKDITDYLEQWAPLPYQESYDNSGLLTGSGQEKLTGILISLDMTEAIVDEALERGCNLIIAHHPVIFKGLKSLTGRNYVERTVIKALKNDIALYAIHTNLDNIHTGVNKKIADTIGLTGTKILAPKKGLLQQLSVFVPRENTQELLQALYAAGAGQIGNYSNCSFRVQGTGTFKPGEEADPAIGSRHQQEEVTEERVEVIFPAYKSAKVLQAMLQAHPYEEVAHFLHSLENGYQETGSGMVGELPEPMEAKAFLQHLKSSMQLSCIRHTALPEKPVQRIALCGGAGSFLLSAAKAAGADFFVSADFKYHEFFDAENKIVIADIGHYESEFFTKELIYDKIRENFTNIALYLSEVSTNPISYA